MCAVPSDALQAVTERFPQTVVAIHGTKVVEKRKAPPALEVSP